MKRHELLGRQKQWERKVEILGRTLLWITLDFTVVARGDDGETIREVRKIPDYRLLIDRAEGERLLLRPEEVDDDVLELVADAHPIPVHFAVSEDQLAGILDDTSRVVAWFGGERGGKTQALAIKGFRMWMALGGFGAQFLCLSPDMDQSQIFVEKLFVGQDDTPPVFPPELVIRYPETRRADDQRGMILDGSEFHHRYGSVRRKGGNIKGRGYRGALIDEVCEIPPIKVWRVVRGRVNKRGGRVNQIAVASTPEAGHWAETEIKLRADREPEGTYRYWHLDMRDNPYIPLSEVAELVRDKGGEDDPVCQREVFGRWVAANSRAFYRFDTQRHIASSSQLEADRGWQDCTPQIAGRFFQGARGLHPELSKWLPLPLHEVCGQDFNLALMATVGLRVGRDAAGKLIAVASREFITKDKGTDAHALALYQEWGPRAIACDPSGAQYGDPRRVGEGRTDRLAMKEVGHDCRTANVSENGQPYRLPELDSLRLVNRLFGDGRLFVDPSCRNLIQGLVRIEADIRGRQVTRVRTGSDSPEERLKGPADAFRYVLWALFRSEMYGWEFAPDTPSLTDIARAHGDPNP